MKAKYVVPIVLTAILTLAFHLPRISNLPQPRPTKTASDQTQVCHNQSWIEREVVREAELRQSVRDSANLPHDPVDTKMIRSCGRDH